MELKIEVQTLILEPKEETYRDENLAIEVPYQVFLNDKYTASSMVLPVGLKEFAVGFLFGQGYISIHDEVKEIYICQEGSIAVYADIESIEPKEMIVTSGCGGTGRIAREMLEGIFNKVQEYTITLQDIRQFITEVLHCSSLQQETHCVHTCGFWSEDKTKLCYEDIGRHNAVDKIIGAVLLNKLSPNGAIYTTGRLTSDMVLKCARLGIPIVMSRTAPSSLALEIARRANITLIGYARPDRVNIFHAPWRIIQ